MNAMIFAAGLGTRLKPLTNDRPKALVELAGVALLEITIRRLEQTGFKQIIVNIHHFAQLVKAFLAERKWHAEILISDESDFLRETGGGLLYAASLLGDKPFLVHNVDIISDLDLGKFYQHHIDSGSLATLAIRDRPSSRKLLFLQDGQLCGWQHQKTGETRWAIQSSESTSMAFSGVHVIDPSIFKLMKKRGKFSIIDTYLNLAGSYSIIGYDHSHTQWMDVGKFEDIGKAEALYTSFQT